MGKKNLFDTCFSLISFPKVYANFFYDIFVLSGDVDLFIELINQILRDFTRHFDKYFMTHKH